MPSPIGTTSPTALQPALELIYLATLQPELASQNLRKLVLANPDYFRNLPESSFKVVLKIAGDMTFERLGCVSYIPLLDQLYASIELKRDWGYSLSLHSSSSREYVRFYISCDGGNTWQNEGLTAMHVSDEPGAQPRIHLLTKRIELREKLQSLQTPPAGARHPLLEHTAASRRPGLDPSLGKCAGDSRSHRKTRCLSDGSPAARVLGPFRRRARFRGTSGTSF